MLPKTAEKRESWMQKVLQILFILSMVCTTGCEKKLPQFSADWPETPVYKKSGFAHTYIVDKDDYGYIVTVIDYDKDKVKELGQQQFLEDHQKNVKQSWAVNKVINREEIKHGENPGYKCEIRGTNMKLKMQTYMIENRLYSIGVVVKPKTDWPADTDTFLDSLKPE